MTAGSLRQASVIVMGDSGSGAGFGAYRVDGAELGRLIAGQAPAADAPAGYDYTAFAFIVTVSGGQVTALDQQFHS